MGRLTREATRTYIQQQQDQATRTHRQLAHREQEALTQTMVEAIHLRRRVVRQEAALTKETTLTKQQAQKIDTLEHEHEALKKEAARLRQERDELEKSVHKGRNFLRELVMQNKAIQETVTFLRHHPVDTGKTLGDTVESVLEEKRVSVERDPRMLEEAERIARFGIPTPG